MNNLFNTMQMRILGGLAILMVMVALASYATLNFEKVRYVNPAPATVSVTGEGEVLAVPDVGTFSFSVMAEAEEATKAQELSGTKINDILAYLREMKIEDKDIKVEYYSLQPRYRWEERVCPVGSYCPPGERIADGFEVVQSIMVKVRDTAAAPSIIAGVGERGATNISNLSFTVDDTDALQAEARAKAIADAQEKAVVLAGQLGVRLVRLAGYYESGEPIYQPYAKMAAMDMDESAGFGGAELPVGEESTTIRVNLTFEVR